MVSETLLNALLYINKRTFFAYISTEKVYVEIFQFNKHYPDWSVAKCVFLPSIGGS
jgi:hypothetical protein